MMSMVEKVARAIAHDKDRPEWWHYRAARAAIEAVLDSLTPVEATAILDSYGIEYAIFTDNGGDE